MKKIKNILLLTSALIGFSNISGAQEVKTKPSHTVISDLQIKLTGFGHFQAAYRNQDGLNREEKNISANRQHIAFYNDAALFADISNKTDEFSYGGKIVLVPTAKRKGSPSYNGSHLYLESEYGRIEGGSPMSASSNMYMDASVITSATGGDWDRYGNLATEKLKQGKPSAPTFATFAEFFLDSKLVTDIDNRPYSTEPGRAVSYYTPKFEFAQGSNIQIGISYIPDSSNTGADSPSKNSVRTDKKGISDTEYFVFDKSVKNALSGGVTIKHSIADGIDLKIGLTGEFGKASKAQKFNIADTTKPVAEYKLKDLRTYNIGTVLTVGNFSYAASFGSIGKSLTTKEYHKTSESTIYYSGAVAYKQGPFSTSLIYFHSDQFKNTLDSVTIGTDYKLAPGLMPYVEISGFNLKGRPEFAPELQKKKTRGTVALIGAKLSL